MVFLKDSYFGAPIIYEDSTAIGVDKGDPYCRKRPYGILRKELLGVMCEMGSVLGACSKNPINTLLDFIPSRLHSQRVP